MAMKPRFRALASLAILSLSAPTATAGDHKEGPPLIGHEKLQAKLNDPKVRIIDARPRADYDKGHLPGAVWADPKPFQGLTKAEAIRDKAAWSKAIAPLGLSGEVSEVYIYDAARQHDAAKLWWLLSYAGAKGVGLVDGGYPLWEREKRPTTAEAPGAKPGEFAPEFRAKLLAERADVREATQGSTAQLLDARSAEEYRGEKAPKAPQAAGHIPGARSLDGYSLVDEEGRFRKPEEQKRILAEAGFAADRPVITYSQGGARSAIATFALKRLGVPARHYAPGLADWSSDAKAPIVSGREANQASR